MSEHSAHDGDGGATVGHGAGHDMTPWFHFLKTDNLYFLQWHPSTGGAIAGAAIGLFFLAIFERWLNATKRSIYARWHARALAESSKEKRTLPPFVLAYDLPRGVLHAFHAFIGYLLMLALMTFQASYLITIVAGAGVGEVIFGRLNAQH